MVEKHYFHIPHIHKSAVQSSPSLSDVLDHMYTVCTSVQLVFCMGLDMFGGHIFFPFQSVSDLLG